MDVSASKWKDAREEYESMPVSREEYLNSDMEQTQLRKDWLLIQCRKLKVPVVPQ